MDFHIYHYFILEKMENNVKKSVKKLIEGYISWKRNISLLSFLFSIQRLKELNNIKQELEELNLTPERLRHKILNNRLFNNC